MNGLNRDQWTEKLDALGGHLNNAEITVIGSWPVIEWGLPGRTSMNLNVWMPASRFDVDLFREACVAADLDLDPTGEVCRPCVRLMYPGDAHVPPHEFERNMWCGGLILSTPPPAVLIASKLVRTSDRDFHDMVFLKHHFRVETEDIVEAVNAIDDKAARETAMGNLRFLEFTATSSPKGS